MKLYILGKYKSNMVTKCPKRGLLKYVLGNYAHLLRVSVLGQQAWKFGTIFRSFIHDRIPDEENILMGKSGQCSGLSCFHVSDNDHAYKVDGCEWAEKLCHRI